MTDTYSDDDVLTNRQTAEMTGLSLDTLERLHRRGEGPKRLKLSPRRIGYRRRSIREWLKSRESETVVA